MRHFQPHAIALALLALASTSAALGQSTTPTSSTASAGSTELKKISVAGEGDDLGTGLMIEDDTAKAKSTVTRAQIEKTRSSSNPFQALNLNPGVNASSYDATGLFGGSLRVRGFNSDQMGFTINGAPVNDSGSFAVYPQEYTDSENLCEMFVTQGATDTEAPHVGASGGNVGLSTCGPEAEHRVRVAYSIGDLDYRRTFVRVDTGKIGDLSAFISASKSKVDKWRGKGGADREHIDAAVEYTAGQDRYSATLLYNNALTNNFRGLTLAQVKSEGYDADYATTIPQHLTPVAGTAQNESSIASGTAYYKYALNPFRNVLLTAAANVQLSPALRLDIEPYYWYGYGTGGVQQTSLAESNSGSKLGGGIGDLNGDGDTLDTVMVYRGSVTETHRPGVTTKLSYTQDNHHILGGLWLERAEHRQTQPATYVTNDGSIGSLWLDNDSKLVRLQDGSLYQGRNWKTISTGVSVFVQDGIDLMDDKLRLTPSLSWRSLDRDFHNYANYGSGGGADYQDSRTYSRFLPGLSASYQFTPEWQGFASVSKNFRTPGNFELAYAVSSVSYTDGDVSSSTVKNTTHVKPETSVNMDLGTRYRGEWFDASATLFYVDFKNRIASSWDESEQAKVDSNVGGSRMRGLELEVGSHPIHGFSAYASATYTKSTINDDLKTASGTTTYTANTSGKQFPDTPKGMFALSGQWAQGPYLINLSGKYTSTRFLTLTNDQAIPGYITLDLNAAYQLPSLPFVKSALIRLNITNLGNKRYFSANSGSGTSITTNATGTGASQPTVYPGAPRFTSVTFQADF